MASYGTTINTQPATGHQDWQQSQPSPAHHIATTGWPSGTSDAYAGRPQAWSHASQRAHATTLGTQPADVRPVGPVAETAPVDTLILASSDNFGPTVTAMKIIVENLPPGVRVELFVDDSPHWDDTQTYMLTNPLKNLPPHLQNRIRVHRVPLDANWVRDFCPEPVLDAYGRLTLTAFQPNNHQAAESCAAGPAMARALGIPVQFSDLNLDGGNFVHDDRGRVFVTDAVLARNPQKSREVIRAELMRVLGAQDVIFLPAVPHEPTGHADMAAKFVGNNTMVVASSTIPGRKEGLDRIADDMRQAGFQVARIANADPPKLGKYMPSFSSYANALLINGTAFVPQYFDPEAHRGFHDYLEVFDQKAAATYRELGFRVVQVPAANLISRMGSIHCMTKTLPAAS